MKSCALHGGLNGLNALAPHYQGASIYSEWETTDPEWQYWQEHFLKP
jgi:hypothetical protein